MSSLALHLKSGVPDACAPRRSRGTPAYPRQGIFRRIFAAIARSDQRRIEKEVARFLAAHGGRFTDDIERQLGERFFRGR